MFTPTTFSPLDYRLAHRAAVNRRRLPRLAALASLLLLTATSATAQSHSADALSSASADENYARYQERRRAAIEALQAPAEGAADAGALAAFERGEIRLSEAPQRTVTYRAPDERLSVPPDIHERADAAFRAPENAVQQPLAGPAEPPAAVVTTWALGQVKFRSTAEQGSGAGGLIPAPRTAPGAAAEAVEIPDSALRQAIVNGLGKEPAEPITTEDMATLRSIQAEYAGIADLSSLSFAVNLMRLDLDGNEISDLSELENLVNLQHLSLDGNLVTDLSPLANLTGLKTLDLSHNGLDSIYALVRLNNLTVLALGGNPAIIDLRPLANLSQLTRLYLYGNGIEELGGLGELDQLKFLTLGSNRISDIDELGNLSQLEELHLWANTIEDTSPLSGLTHLKRLYLQRNSITAPQLAGLARLERLGLEENLITSISGLSGLTSLEWLSLHTNQIVDIEPLAGMTSLELLSLHTNQIVNIEPLAGMTSLERLSLHTNQIVNIEPLAGMTSLELLLHTNQIVNIEPLAGMTSLERLSLHTNQIVDIEPLAAMTSLELLSLHTNQIVDIEPLAAMTSLDLLSLGANQIVNIEPLAGMTSLEWLSLHTNQIVNIKPLGGMIKLQTLLLFSNSIVDIEPLSAMTSLEWLSLHTNQIVDIEPLAGMTSLSLLSLGANQIVNIEPLGGMIKLRTLFLFSNSIVDIEPLSAMTSLEWLSLHTNQIVDIEPLAAMTSLEWLSLGANQIVNIEPLGGMIKLQTLLLFSNSIVDIEPLSAMTSLELLSLSSNQIVNIEPLTGLASLLEVWLYSNPLDERSINTHAPVLQDRGVITWLGIPDLTAALPSVSSAEIDAGGLFNLSVTVSNSGNRSASAVVRYYRSLNAVISAADTEASMASSNWLASGHTSAQRIALSAPAEAGTYYYGACVDTAAGETNTANNCSAGARLTVGRSESDRTFAVDDALPGIPTSGAFDPEVTSNGSVDTSGETTTISLNDDGYIELTDGTRYTCNTSGGCEVVDGVVTKGSITSSGETIPSADDRAELIVDAPTVSDSAPERGEYFTLRATVRNQGGGRSPSTTLRYYRSSDAVISAADTQVGTDYVFALAAERTSSQSALLRAPSDIGTYYYGACVDAVAEEWDTTNNCSTGVRVTVNGSDLIVDAPTVSDSAPERGEYFTLRATLRNQGGGRSTSTTLRYYRSSDAVISAADTQVGTDYVFALAAAGTSSESMRPRAPSDAGTYYYGACVDTVAGETDTTNNCSTGVRVTVNGSDLIVNAPTVSDSAPDGGEYFTLRATVRNQGGGRAASTTLRYYRSSDAVISAADTQVGTDYVSALAAAGTSSESMRPRAPSDAGTYYYGACVDTVAGETDTTNNCSNGVKVEVSGGGGGTPPPPSTAPDLTVESITVTESSPNAGASFTLRATVRNRGGGSSAATTLRYYRSTDSTITSSDAPAGADSVSGLSASETSAESISLTAPSDTGTYYYGACVDSVTDESNTANNCSTGVRVTVGGGTDPQPDSYTTLEGFRVESDGGFELKAGSLLISLGSRQCFDAESGILEASGANYTIHSSKWQRRADAGSAWADIPGTEKQGELCGYSLTAASAGEYRMVVDMTIGSERGKYSSENSIIVN